MPGYRDLSRRQFSRGLGGLATSFVVLGASERVASAAPSAAQTRRKINLAGRQRMLSQRIAKAAFMFQLEVEPDRHLEMLATAHDLFDTTLKDLRRGNPDLFLDPEENLEVIKGLGRVSSAWSPYRSAVKEVIEAQQVSAINLFAIVRANLPVLKASHAVVQSLEAAYGGAGAGQSELARTINVAGRQRMLTQKMTKESCQLSIYGRPKELRAQLSETITLFDTSLKALTGAEGEVSVVPAPTQAISDKLAEVDTIWQEFGAVMSEIAGGRQPTMAEYAYMSTKNDVLLKTMNEAVGLYENVDG
ncbi:MAG: type IV pili methyl-accepting chemotaxis transducer N-terminal domain-containing protein [Pseudomonadota bacterium]